MKIGFIGMGNMASAIAGGIIKSGIVPTSEICFFDVSDAAKQHGKALGFTLLGGECEVVKNSEYVFLCVKPQSFTDVLDTVKASVSSKNVFLTIAAGVTIKSITNIIGDVAVIRAMPNTPLLIGCGTVALTKNDKATNEEFDLVKSVFSSVGTVYELPEDKFNEVINVNGSTPAYIYLFAKTIADYAQESGIPFEIALPMFCDTLKGSADMLVKSGHTPDELIKMVSSKGGTTIAALNKFADTGFSDSLRAGMKACVDRAYELSI